MGIVEYDQFPAVSTAVVAGLPDQFDGVFGQRPFIGDGDF
jgi:hypothetical protein